MSTKLDKIVKTYKSLAQIPALLGAKLGSNGVVTSLWSQRNIEKGKTTKFVRSILVNNDLSKVTEIHPLDVTDEILSKTSESEKYRAVLRDNDGKQFLEVWQKNNLIRSVDLNALDLHGSVYSDVEFGSFEWSPDEKKILYVAEKKVAKSEPFYKRKGKTEEGSGDAPKSKGEEYVFVQDWGEQLVGKKSSILAQYDIENDVVEILEGIPVTKCVAQPKYSPDGTSIIGVVYETEPRKLGLIYCSNRLSTIFSLGLDGKYVELSLANKCVKSPRFSPDGKTIVWLQRGAGGPHAHAMALVKTSWPLTENSQVQIVVEAVEESIETVNKTKFYGLYNTTFAGRCWASNNRLIVSTNQNYTINSYIVEIDTGNITELTFDEGSQIVLDVSEDTILVARRNFLKPDLLAIAKLPKVGSESTINFIELTSNNIVDGFDSMTYKYLDLQASNESFNKFNAIYIGPKSGAAKSVPLVVWPHGGPHGAFANFLMLEAALFLKFNYGILLINYRGSTGAGAKSIDFLPGKIGTADVSDCIQAVDEAFSRYSWLDSNAASLIGGSHGGFLVAHLSGQYPDKFKSVVARNPVIDVASMSIISDIPDWCYVEAGKEYTQVGEIDEEILLKMRNKSPIVHAHKVKAPTLLQIGSKDLRVPPHQGTDYYYRLKANGVNVEMNLYDDNHPLGTVPNEIDNVINTLLWVEEHIGRTE